MIRLSKKLMIKIITIICSMYAFASCGMFKPRMLPIKIDPRLSSGSRFCSVDTKIHNDTLEQKLLFQKQEARFYSYLSIGVAYTTFVCLAGTYQNLHQSLISDNYHSGKKQMEEDERTLKKMNNILYAGTAAQAFLIFRREIAGHLKPKVGAVFRDFKKRII